jgi:hypothetical protein
MARHPVVDRTGWRGDAGGQRVERLFAARRSPDAPLHPKTFDLQDRALLALSAYTETLDERDGLLWMSLYYDRDPLCHRHTPSDGNQMPKFAEGIDLMRLMTGSTLNSEADGRLWAWMEAHTGEDGLLYKLPQQADAFGNGRMLLARLLHYQLTGDAKQRYAFERAMQTLLDRIYVHGDPKAADTWATFPRVWDGGSQVMADTAGWPIYNAAIILPMAGWYELTGDERARDLARWITNSILRDGEIGEDGSWAGWFHHFTHAGMAMLKYAVVTDDNALCHRMAGFYECGRAAGTVTGFFPEISDQGTWIGQIGNEGCCTADMICLAAHLSRAGLGDYWDDLERYLKNQFAEIQLTKTDFLERIPRENVVGVPIRQDRQEQELEDFSRYVGSLAGWAAANDFAGPAHLWLQQCCLGNSGRAIYAGQEAIVTHEAGQYRVNMPMNRSTAELDVDSYLPYEGKLTVRAKQAMNLAVRVPEYVEPRNVRALVNGKPLQQTIPFEGRYAQFACDAGDEVELSFAVEERTATFSRPGRPDLVLKHSIVDENSGGGLPLPRSNVEAPAEAVAQILKPVEYRVTFRGNTVVNIDPKGTIYPIYEREAMRQGPAPMERCDRYVEKRPLLHWA